MKSTLKALKYSFKLLNHPFTYGMLIFSLIYTIRPIVDTILLFKDYELEAYTIRLFSEDLIFSIIMSIIWICILMAYINARIGSCKYNYSVNFARKLHTVVPVIYSFFGVTLLFGVIVCIAAIKLGSSAFTAHYIIISVSVALIGVASSATCKRKADFIVPYIIAYMIFEIAFFRSDELSEINISAPAVIATSFIIIATGFVFSCWYMNHLWDKGVRFIKHKHGFESLLGNK